MSQPSSSTAAPVKFAYWVPNVSGGLVVSTIEQRTDWSLEYNQRLAVAAEKAGFEYALSQIRFTAGYGAEYQHESVSFSQALLHATTKLKVLAAILPGPWNPAVVAKQIATIDHISNGRIAINVVSGWFKGEFQAIGEPWLEHDERYRRSNEFIRALKGIWTQDNFTFKGDFYRFSDYTLSPKPVQKPHPEIFQGGSSRAARDNAASVSDWYFTNGNTPEGLKAQIDDIQAKAAQNGHTVRIGVNAFVIARATRRKKPGPCWRTSSGTRTSRRCMPSATRSSRPARHRPKARATGPSRPSRTWCNTTTASAPTSSARRSRSPSASWRSRPSAWT